MARHTTRSRRNTTLTRSCSLSAGRNIRQESLAQKQKPISQRLSRKQVIAIGFSKTRKKRPECKRVLQRNISTVRRKDSNGRMRTRFVATRGRTTRTFPSRLLALAFLSQVLRRR